MKSLFLIFAGILITVSTALSQPGIRVRVLERYHPKEIYISYPESIYEKVIINMEKSFPVNFKRNSTYTISIPSMDFKREYKGTLKIYKEDELIVVNKVPMENYIASVVISELGMKPPEAMCAQAVISRTWALNNLKPRKKWDFNDLTISQVYKGFSAFSKKAMDIISQTEGEILTYKGKKAEIFFHAKCSSRIFSPFEIWGREIPYLKARKSIINTPYRWKARISKDVIEEILSESESDLKKIRRSGKLFISTGNYDYPIDTFRLMINRVLGWATLKSTDFTILREKSNYLFKGKGHGHLTGFCQEAAVEMALQGYSYKKILSAFYPGTDIVMASE